MAREPGPALILVDVQHDFLRRPGVVPSAGVLVDRLTELLAGWRELGRPVVHLRTMVRADGTDRMPHWRAQAVTACIEGTDGADPPPSLVERPGEPVVRKRFYSGFGDGRLEAHLRELGVTEVVVAGLYTHACVRQAALDAYERGFSVRVVADAVASDDPVHAALTEAWLSSRSAPFLPAAELLATPSTELEPTEPAAIVGGEDRWSPMDRGIVHRDPCDAERVLAVVPVAAPTDVAAAIEVVAAAQATWAERPPTERAHLLERWAEVLERVEDELVASIVEEVAKPRPAALDEVRRAIGHVRTAATMVSGPLGSSRAIAAGVAARPRPLGVVGIVMPWNNPLALPCGKVAPALGFGNGVVFKPAPQGARTARLLARTLEESGLPAELVALVNGDARTAQAIADHPAVRAVAVTGSIATGRSLAARCGIRGIPIQAELGGNNAAVVLADADLDEVVPTLVRGAYSYSGQRCTSLRRFVVDRSVVAAFVERASEVIDELTVGDPRDTHTDVGPLIDVAARDRVARVVAGAIDQGATLLRGGRVPRHLTRGAWYEPTLLVVEDPDAAVVQEETFGPVVVVQPADGVEHAIALANGVVQGLVQAVCTADAVARRRVLDAAEAGIVLVGAGPLPIHPDAPFGGRKSSGIGPSEHGEWDAQFLSVPQAVYGEA